MTDSSKMGALLAALAILLPRPAAAQAAYETIYSFKGSPDGADPKGALLIAKDGALYGTTYAGGTSVDGTVFELTHATGGPWQETVLHNFSGSDGQYPASTLVFGSTGSIYGTTSRGGGGGGVIFEMTPPSTAGGAWTETVLYSFTLTLDGQNVFPNGQGLVRPERYTPRCRGRPPAVPLSG
jgi:uncharacterized repeat protein (TIGR03803 family)